MKKKFTIKMKIEPVAGITSWVIRPTVSVYGSRSKIKTIGREFKTLSLAEKCFPDIPIDNNRLDKLVKFLVRFNKSNHIQEGKNNVQTGREQNKVA